MTKKEATRIAKVNLKYLGIKKISKKNFDDYVESIYYWCNAKENDEQVAYDYSIVTDKVIKEYYKSTIDEMNDDIYVFYYSYGTDGVVEFADTRKKLTPKELNKYKRATNSNVKSITRYNALISKISHDVKLLDINVKENTENTLKSITEVTLNNNEKEFEKTNKRNNNPAMTKQEKTKEINKIVNTKFENKKYDQRISDNTNKFINAIIQKINNSLTRGINVEELTKELSKTAEISYKNARKIVITETNACYNRANMEYYKKYGLNDKYQIITAKDERTCKNCASLNLKVFNVADAVEGANMPKFHPYCRCTTVPFFEPDDDVNDDVKEQ